MRTTRTKLAAGLPRPAGPLLQHLADSDELILARWRLTLDSAWQRKADEVIALSRTFCGLTTDDNGSPANRTVRVSRRLHARTERAYDELAAIEDAIARIDAGTYGMCADCEQRMSDEWLADDPAVRYCPDCSLRLVLEAPPLIQQDQPRPGPGVRKLTLAVRDGTRLMC